MNTVDYRAAERALTDAVEQSRRASMLQEQAPLAARIRAGRLELSLDTPSGRARTSSLRQALLGCGRALLTMRAALAREDLVTTVDRFPDGLQAPVFARLTARLSQGADDPVPDQRLGSLIDGLARYSAEVGSPPEVDLSREATARLAAAATREDVLLVRVLRPDHLAVLNRIGQAAQDALGPRADLWRVPVPPSHAPQSGPQSAAQYVPQSQPSGVPHPRSSGPSATVLLLGTRDDGPVGWLRSGEAVQRVTLELIRLGAAVRPLPALSVVPNARATLRRGLSLHFCPQVLLRVVHDESAP